MFQALHFPVRFVHLALILFLAVMLSACAGRPRPLDTARLYNVTSVQVTAQSSQDAGFANKLQKRLEASVGRPQPDSGLATELQIAVIERNGDRAFASFFSGPAGTARLDIDLVNAATGRVLKSRSLSRSASSTGGDGVLIEGFVNDIRTLLGLSGNGRHPVAGIKRGPSRSNPKPGTLDASSYRVDPLLNGEVTPTTPVGWNDIEPATAANLSKPPLSATPDVEANDVIHAPVIAPAPAAKQTPKPTTADKKRKVRVVLQSPVSLADNDGEPCVITIDKDCDGPDSR